MVVTNCNPLNIRIEPSIDAEIIFVLPPNATLLVDSERSTDEWFSVCTEFGIEGYCMKKYVTPKQ